MIYKNIKSLPKQINFINTNTFELEDHFHALKKIFYIKIYNKNEIDKEKQYLTINLNYYLEKKNEIKIDLFLVSVDNDNSHFLNLTRYIKTNNSKKIQYKKIFFKKFLFDNFPLKQIDSKINKTLGLIGLKVEKFRINNFLWLPKISFKDDIYKGHGIGISSYNSYVPRNKEFNSIFKKVYLNLSDEKSKKIYKDTVYGRPSIIWKNYYNLLFDDEHYQDYLNFNNSNIINLGVDNGFEIPFFLSNEINKIINVDPTEEKNLHPYVKSFVEEYKNKIIFDGSFLYDAKNVYGSINKNNKCTDLFSIVKKYSCTENLIIKSDIEGLEIKMLDELKELIPKYRPQLAISIYHVDKNFYPRHSHLVVIPEKLTNICKEYKFFLRHYTYNRRETVFFCIPQEKFQT
ncbi:hypothetical protein OA346_01805 [Candidatus Pelagibacter sp.]|nr:hypothetical protein [Candidatus Pelagibacter sp.]